MSKRPSRRTLAAVLFTDMVDSTSIAVELGDRRWKEMLARHNRIIRRELKRQQGREIDTAGDGFFAVFHEPAAAIVCALEADRAIRELGIEIRAAVHVGELEPGEKPSGIAVHTGARILAMAHPGDILVSLTTKDLVAGSGFEFGDRGTHELKGVPDEVHVFAVTAVDGNPIEAPPTPEEAAARRARVPAASALPRRRRWRLVAAAAVLLAAFGTFMALSAGGSDAPPEGATGVPANAVAALDARTGEVLVRKVLPKGNLKLPEIEVGEGSVWLLRNPVIVKVDPADGSFDTLGISGGGIGIPGTSGLGVGFGKLWTGAVTFQAPESVYTVVPIESGSLDPQKAIRLPANAGSTRSIAVGFGSVWLGTDSGTVIRLDPKTRDATPIEVGEIAAPLTVGSDAVWALDDLEGEVIRVDPETNEVSARIPLTAGLDRIAIGEGSVWVLDTAAGILTQIDEEGEHVRQVISVGDATTDVAAGFGSVWVARGGTVLRIDPITGRIDERLRVSSHPIVRLAVEPAGGRLWLNIAG